jgi:hypothetical protein
MRVLRSGILLLTGLVSLTMRPAPQGVIEIGACIAIAILLVGYFLTFILEVPGPRAIGDR